MSMVQMEKIFSESVLADTFPNPTLVRLLKAKYSDVTQLLRMEGPPPSSPVPVPDTPSPSDTFLQYWLEFQELCPVTSDPDEFHWLLLAGMLLTVEGTRVSRGLMKQGVPRRLASSWSQPERNNMEETLKLLMLQIIGNKYEVQKKSICLPPLCYINYYTH